VRKSASKAAFDYMDRKPNVQLPWPLGENSQPHRTRCSGAPLCNNYRRAGTLSLQPSMKAIHISGVLFALATLPCAATADDDRGRRPHGSEYKHDYQNGNCKVERKRGKDGDFEEKIDCKGGHYGGHGRRHVRSEFKEEFRDGNCKVKRELQKDGDYKEERKCKGHQHIHAPAPVYVVPQPVMVAPRPVYVPPPAVVVEPGVVIQGTIRVK
jgi:hypothetical protein